MGDKHRWSTQLAVPMSAIQNALNKQNAKATESIQCIERKRMKCRKIDNEELLIAINNKAFNPEIYLVYFFLFAHHSNSIYGVYSLLFQKFSHFLFHRHGSRSGLGRKVLSLRKQIKKIDFLLKVNVFESRDGPLKFPRITDSISIDLMLSKQLQPNLIINRTKREGIKLVNGLEPLLRILQIVLTNRN